MCRDILCDNRFLLAYIQGFARSRAQFSEDKEAWKMIEKKITEHLEKQDAEKHENLENLIV